MTIWSDASGSDEALVNLANYALCLLRKSLQLKSASGITADFIVHLSVELFGSDILPYPEPSSFIHHHENVNAVVHKLAEEIGVELDHIKARSVLNGNRRAISNLLELITAFIVHCVDEDLLDFTGNDNSLESPASNLPLHTLGVRTPKSQIVDPLMVTSPELPRSVGRPCLPPTSILSSYHPSSIRPVFDSGVPQSNSIDDTTAAFSKLPEDRLDNWPTTVRKHEDSISPATPFPRHPSILSMQADVSPPATPKAADNILEIVNNPSPGPTVVSLHSSPVCTESTNISPGTLNQANVAASSLLVTNPKIPVEQSNNENNVLSVCNNRQSLEGLSSVGTEFYPQEANQTLLDPHQRRRKVSSSSSGCGHSPTHTLTVPGVSATSSPLSPSESALASVIGTRDDVHVSLTVPRSRLRRKPTHVRKRRSAHGGHSQDTISSTTTGSILAWTHDRRDEGMVDDHTSVLSSSVYSETWDRTSIGPCPSASVLIAHTEGFTKALKRRLDYLRTIFCRAHEEAEAVSRLVQAVGAQNSETLELMHRCMQCEKFQTLEKPYSVESVLQQILTGVNLLLSSRVPNHDKDTHRRGSRTRRKHGDRNIQNGVPCASELEDLIEMKHELMMDALRLCRSEIDSRQLHKESATRCPRCNIAVVG